MLVRATERLRLRRLTLDDAEFMLAILNDPDFVRFVGDRGVRTVDSARDYLRRGPIDSYVRYGFGLYLVELAETVEPLGICGLVRRDALPDPDIGFAFLPAHRGQGYAVEAAAAVLEHARDDLALARVIAIVAPGNDRSSHVLGRIGLRRTGSVRLSVDDIELELYAKELGGRQ